MVGEGTCVACARELCGRERVISRMMGHAPDLLCLDCLARAVGCTAEGLCADACAYLSILTCFRREWERARHCQRDGAKPCCPSRVG